MSGKQRNNGKRRDSRQSRGRALAQDPRIKQIDGPLWFAPSEKAGGYVVNVEAGTCSCPDHTGHNVRCKHIHAVELVQGGMVKGDQVAIAFPAPARPTKTDLSAEEQAHVQASLRFLRTRSVGLDPLAKALRYRRKALEYIAYSGRPLSAGRPPCSLRWRPCR